MSIKDIIDAAAAGGKSMDQPGSSVIVKQGTRVNPSAYILNPVAVPSFRRVPGGKGKKAFIRQTDIHIEYAIVISQ